MRLSVVIPIYNEQEALPALLEALRPVLEGLDCESEVVFVDDGSRDASRSILARKAAGDDRIKVLGFSRNFGHQAAITAGLDFASGDAVVVMDADLQDPPELLPGCWPCTSRGTTWSRPSGSGVRARGRSSGGRRRSSTP